MAGKGEEDFVPFLAGAGEVERRGGNGKREAEQKSRRIAAQLLEREKIGRESPLRFHE